MQKRNLDYRIGGHEPEDVACNICQAGDFADRRGVGFGRFVLSRKPPPGSGSGCPQVRSPAGAAQEVVSEDSDRGAGRTQTRPRSRSAIRRTIIARLSAWPMRAAPEEEALPTQVGTRLRPARRNFQWRPLGKSIGVRHREGAVPRALSPLSGLPD